MAVEMNFNSDIKCHFVNIVVQAKVMLSKLQLNPGRYYSLIACIYKVTIAAAGRTQL